MTPSRTSSIRPLHSSATAPLGGLGGGGSGGLLLNPPGRSAVTQSRRASSTGLGASAAASAAATSPSLRRQKTIAEMKSSSRTILKQGFKQFSNVLGGMGDSWSRAELETGV